MNAVGVRLELGQDTLALAKDGKSEMTPATVARMLALGERSFGGAREVLGMRGQCFTDIVQYGVEAAQQMAFLVGQSHNAVHSLSQRSVSESLTQRLESEAAKILAKKNLDRATGGDGVSNTGSVTPSRPLAINYYQNITYF
jgi:hypothetical protein